MASSPMRPRSSGLLPICLALQLLLAGCGTGLFGEGDERLDDINAVPAWFERHRGELEVVMRLLLPHQSIHRVWGAEPSSSQQYGKLSLEDEAAYAGTFSIMERLSIAEVIVWRRDGKGPAFDFVLWRIGIAVSGRFTFLRYSEDRDERKARLAYWDSTPNQVLHLGDPGWFAIRSSSD